VTPALMIVLAAAVAAWVLAPLLGSAGRGVFRRGLPADPHDARPVAKHDWAGPVLDGGATRQDASGEA
jgi:hypothetical protein